MVVVCQKEEVDCVKKECDEVVWKQIEIGIMFIDDVDVLFDDDEDNILDVMEVMVGVLFVECLMQSVLGLLVRVGFNMGDLYWVWLDFKVYVIEVFEVWLSNKEKYLSFFKFWEEGGDYIQDVMEMIWVFVILKMDFSKSLL